MKLPAVLIGTTLVLLCSLLFLQFQPTHAANADAAAATYSHGVLRVQIPYQAPHPGAGVLSVEILNPEDKILGRSVRRVQVAGKGTWQEALQLSQAPPVEDLVWQRMRYRFAYGGDPQAAVQGTESVSEILRMPVIHVLGQKSYLAGGAAGVRIVATDSKNEIIPGASTVRIELAAPDAKPRMIYSGALNARGTAEAAFHMPPGLAGNFQLRYIVDTPIGSTEYVQPVRVEDKVSILLSSEKPIYQPGQTIHVRALALDRANHAAAGGRKITFEVEDSRGNKVFKQAAQTSKFGIASAEFVLADEVNLGTYHMRALMDEGANRAEIALNVQKYVLPKFKVAVEFSGKDQKARHGYRPGDHVTGTVRANYFFGKPVDGAEIGIQASSMDVAVFEAAAARGKTDADGAYRFDLKLPAYFAGKPLQQGAARVLIEATVKDSAGHSEARGEPITVSESPLVVTAIPEGGTLVPNLENQLFIVASYADGKPAQADVRVRSARNAEQTASTDAGGVAVVRIKPGTNTENVQVEASDKEGNRTSVSVPLQVRAEAEQILLRTEHATYRAGERMVLRVFSSKQGGPAYIDVVKDGQTILTRDVDLQNGQAELDLTATPEMAGTLDISAYQFGRDARPVGDHRLVFVQPADELKIEATPNAPAYRPGEEARVRFRVTNSRGEGVQAALGLQVVDEAVFALAEKQPGFAKVFFYLEQEAMKPRYEIHSIGMPDIVEPVDKGALAQRDRAARALFAATEMVNPNRLETEFGRSVPQTKYAEYANRYQARFIEALQHLPAKEVRAKSVERSDAWGTALRIETWDAQKRYYLVRSAGPDRKFDTGDDMTAYLEIRTRTVMEHPELGRFEVNVEHERGPWNGLAEITGSVTDETAAAIPGANMQARDLATGKIRSAISDRAGQFVLAGLPAGRYAVQVSSAGFRAGWKEIELAVRDRAVVAVTLRLFAANEVVLVDQMGRGARPFAITGAVNGVGGGFVMKQFAAPIAMPASAEASVVNSGILAKDKADAPAVRVRSYFPEALYINPQIITDQNGDASIAIPMADSITTWRVAMVASTTRGALGSGTSSLKVFQDFFVDLDLPVTLTQGDRVEIPVAVYNYSGARGDVKLQLQPAEWFSLADDAGVKTVAVDAERVGGSHFSIEAKRIGKFKLTLAANMNGLANRADIVVREIEVIPNGREQNMVFNGRLETAVNHDVNFPASAIPEASAILVRLYPGPLSQVVEGMDAILRMPFGCFEQTSSSTYPNVLALDYMKRTKKLTPEVHAKAEGFIANGYQRLLTFEVPGGGFSWFGNAPANKILTAYGLMEFFDMSQVHDVDARLIQRTQQWLALQQMPDGSWRPDGSFINEGATNRYNSDLLRITAYIAWSLENTKYQGPAVEKARQFVEAHLGDKADAYTLAVAANFAADYGKDRGFVNQAMQRLLDARTEKGEQAWWTSQETGVYATGTSATVETTGLAVQALLKWGQASTTASKALSYIASKKDANGTWGTTQATIMALRALLLSTEKGAADVRGVVEIALNGKPVQKVPLTAENNDLLHQFVFKNVDARANQVAIRFEGKGGLAYQVVGRYFVPWGEKAANEPLSIEVAYDRTRLAQDDVARATATIRNNLGKSANMVMVDLGIPPGFDLLSEDLQAFQEKTAGQKGGKLEKFSMTATQAILYFDSLPAGGTVTLHYRLRAKYPIRAKTFASRVYEYYDPDVKSVARPVSLEVRKRQVLR